MALEDTSVVTILATVIVSMMTVFATDFFGLRRDRARMEMEFAWQLRRQRWDALYSALQNCPTFDVDPPKLMQSISNLCRWSANEVEPWIGGDRVEAIRKQREEVEAWHREATHSILSDPNNSFEFPAKLINGFRTDTSNELTAALQRMRRIYSHLLEKQNF
jgi:hypothetical protein